jgi:hypothetical protein
MDLRRHLETSTPVSALRKIGAVASSRRAARGVERPAGTEERARRSQEEILVMVMRTALFALALGVLTLLQTPAAAVDLSPNAWVNVGAGADPNAVADVGNCGGRPCSRAWFPMTYHAGVGKTVLVGGGVGSSGCYPSSTGYINDVWVYDFVANRWTQRRPVDWSLMSSWPHGKDNHVMAYDSVNGRLWILGGTCPTSTVRDANGDFGYYDYAANRFTQVYRANEHGRSSQGPNYSYLFDPGFAFGEGKLVAFSGEPCGYEDPGGRTSWFDVTTNTWSPYSSSPTARPPKREQIENVMVYDSFHRKFILFGGRICNDPSYGKYADTWEYDLATNTWTQTTPAVSPPAREKHTMVYDSLHHVVIMHGGSRSGGGSHSDTWVYDSGTRRWTQIASAGPTPSRYLHGMSYDVANDVVILFGGEGAPNDTWAFRYQPSGPPTDPPSPPPNVRTR